MILGGFFFILYITMIFAYSLKKSIHIQLMFLTADLVIQMAPDIQAFT